VYGVAFNLLRNHRRRMDNRRDTRASSLVLDNLPANSSLFDQLQDERMAHATRRIVTELPIPRDREVVRRFYLEEHGKAEICADLGLSPLHFDKIVFRARRRLRRLFEAHGIDSRDALPARELGMSESLVALE
jgi:RNA polymerase sigma-70 factor, ECF subfamily